MIPPALVVPPDEMPVTLAEAKAHCRVTSDDEDALFTSFISAAVAHLDGYTGVLGRCLIDQDWRQDFAGWGRELRLPFPDVSALALTYVDAAGAEQTVDPALYDVLSDARGSCVRMRSSFTSPALHPELPRPVSAGFTAGFGDAESVPADLKRLICQMVGHWYWYRETVLDRQLADVPLTYHEIVSKYRRVGL